MKFFFNFINFAGNENNLTKKYFNIYTILYLTFFKIFHSDIISQKKNIFPLFRSYFVTDLISGLIHIYFDKSKITNENSYINDQRKGFESHHRIPDIIRKLSNGSYKPHYEMNYSYPFTILILITLGIFNLIKIKIPFRKDIIFFSFWITILQAAHMYAHARNHYKNIPFLIKLLQNSRILLHPIHHSKHHSDPNNSINFCLLSGHMNFILNPLYKFYLCKFF